METPMNRAEFLYAAVQSGHATKKQAEEYAEKSGKTEFTTSDVYEIRGGCSTIPNIGYNPLLMGCYGVNGRTTKYHHCGLYGNSNAKTDT